MSVFNRNPVDHGVRMPGDDCIVNLFNNSVQAKKARTVGEDDDDFMLPLRQRRLPSFIAIDDTVPAPKPSSDTGFYLPLIDVSLLTDFVLFFSV